MKKSVFILIVLTLILGCKKKETVDPQPSTNTSTNTNVDFEYYLDGVRKTNPKITCIVTQGMFMLITEDTIPQDMSTTMTLSTMEVDSVPNTYLLYKADTNALPPSINMASVNIGQGPGQSYKSYGISNVYGADTTSYFEITNLDYINSLVSGKFQFIVYGTDSTDYHIITDGVFTDIELLH